MTHVVDDFNRTDAATLGSNYGVWWSGTTSHAIVSNTATNAANGASRGNRRTAESFANDQWVEIELSTSLPADYSFGVVLRSGAGGFGDAGTGYLLGATGTNGWFINRYDFGGSTLASGTLSSGTWGSGDTIRGTVVGSTLTLYRNGVSIGSTTDSDIASGQPGFWSSTDGDTDIAITSATFSDVFGGSTPVAVFSFDHKMQGIQ